MAAREEILSRYGQSAQLFRERGEIYTPAEFMMESSRGTHDVYVKRKVYDPDTGEYLGTKTVKYETSYSNYKSAARAFNKIEAGKSSRVGERLLQRGELYPRGVRGIPGKPQPGYQENLWKVVLWVSWDERREDGTIVHHEAEERSFIVQSRTHGSAYDTAYIRAATADAADDFVEDWAADEAGYGEVVGDMVIVDRMVFKIQTTSVGGAQVVHIP